MERLIGWEYWKCYRFITKTKKKKNPVRTFYPAWTKYSNPGLQWQWERGRKEGACFLSLSKCGLQLSGCHNCSTWSPPAWGTKISRRAWEWEKQAGKRTLIYSCVEPFLNRSKKKVRPANLESGVVSKRRLNRYGHVVGRSLVLLRRNKWTSQRMLLRFANIAGLCFDFFKNLGIHDYKWLWLVLFNWKDHSNPLCKLRGFLRDFLPTAGLLSENAAALIVWFSVPLFPALRQFSSCCWFSHF